MRTRLQRLIDKRDDLKDEYEKWSFSRPPSMNRRTFQRIKNLDAKIESLQAARHPAPGNDDGEGDG